MRDLPLLDLILIARASQTPTILELNRGDTNRRFYFRDGTIVAFTTDNVREGLTTFLVRRGKLAAGTGQSVQTVAAQDGLTPAQVILRDRMLPIPELAKELSGWTTLLLVQAFAWTDGSFRLLNESPDQAPPETLYELSLGSVITQGVWNRMPSEEVRALVTPYLDFAASTGSSPAFRVTDLRLPPDRLRFWEELRQAPSVRAALRATDLHEEDALRCVYLLHRTGLLDLLPAVSDVDDDLADFGFDDDDMDLDGWLDDLGDLPAEAAPDEEDEPPPPEDEELADSPRMRMRPSAPPPAPPAAPHSSRTGVDLSSIGFRRTTGSATTSSTYHVTAGLREELGAGRRSAPEPEDAVTQGKIDAVVAGPPMPDHRLSSLFEGMDLGDTAKAPPRRVVAPARPTAGPGRAPGRVPTASIPAPGPAKGPAGTGSTPSSPRPTAKRPAPVAASPDDAPPKGPGPVIEDFEWARLPTKEKDRIRGLRTMLVDFEKQNFYERFDLSHEAAPALIKKAYFKMARRFHPDALVDEGDVYRRLAESVFTVISEAYEVLSEDESRDKYTRKYIHGEKDENDLAMERVRELLAAEGSYRNGVRLLNQGKLGKAVEELEEAVARDPDEAEYRGWLGFALFRANQHADYPRALTGEEMLLEAIAAKPTVAALPHLMGKIAMQRKDWLSAKKWLRKTLKMKADNPEALREYKRVDEMTKDGDKSEDSKAGLKGLFGRFGKK